MYPNKRFRIVLTTCLALAFLFAWIRMPATGAAAATPPPNTPAPFDGVVSAGSFDPKAAERGRLVVDGRAKCATCHVRLGLSEAEKKDLVEYLKSL